MTVYYVEYVGSRRCKCRRAREGLLTQVIEYYHLSKPVIWTRMRILCHYYQGDCGHQGGGELDSS